ncbi:MAG: hypothetical protein FWF54_02130 [Candidatus Azobacteroides sp.]|nr:hypothetical protein [Candidatus Azobacteroides sp.]
MKKLIFYLIAFYGSISAFGQPMNARFPSGRYKMAANGFSIYLYVTDDNRFAFQAKTGGSFDDAPLFFNDFLIKGLYTQIGDTIFLQPDSCYTKYRVQYKNSAEVKKDKIRLTIKGFSDYDGTKISVNNTLNIETAMPTDSLFNESAKRKTGKKKDLTFTVDKADSLFLIHPGYYNDEVFAYALPKDADELIVEKLSTGTEKFPDFIKGFKGENANEIVLADKNTDNKKLRPDIISLFYVGDVPDSRITGIDQFTPLPGYYFTTDYKYYSIKKNEDDNALAGADTIPPYAPETMESLPEYRSFNDARNASVKENKYLILYYEDRNAHECDEQPASEYLTDLLNRLQKASEFNRYFILYEASANDKSVFEKYRATEYPSTVILAPDGTLMYISESDCFQSILYDRLYYLYYTPETFNGLLNRIYSEAVLAPAMANAKIPAKKQLEQYLSDVVPGENTDYSYFTSFWEDDNFPNRDISVDSAQTVKYLDLLVNNYYRKETPDSSKIALVKRILSFNPSSGGYNYLYPALSENELTPGYRYLAETYEKYPNLPDRAGILKFMNDQIQNIYYSNDDLDSKQAFYLSAVKSAPSIIPLEMPLIIYTFPQANPDAENPNADADSLITGYLNEWLSGNNLTQKINVSFEKIYANQKEELINVLSSSMRYSDDDDEEGNPEQKDSLKASYKNLIAFQLNNMAWYSYQYVTSDRQDLLTQALSWSEASLSLDPGNPYLLDTCARLLYRSGKRQEALNKQQEAVDRADQVNSSHARREMKNALIRMKNDTLW